jgi:GxxExxY protein
MNDEARKKYSNHERHEKHENYSADQHDTPYRLRVPSPLPPEAEDVITRVIGCAVNVHKALGPGFLESIYKKAMCIELEAQGLPFELERPISVSYRGVDIRGQRVDLIVDNVVVVELKAITRFDEIHQAQVLSYLKTTGLRIGLLINFRVACLPQGLRRVAL